VQVQAITACEELTCIKGGSLIVKIAYICAWGCLRVFVYVYLYK